MRLALEGAHDDVHGYIGGNIGALHASFEDPFVFLLHSNVDRLFAMWQRVPGKEWRLDPERVYGGEGNTGGPKGILTAIDPWAGNPSNDPTIQRVRPWAPPENQQVVKNSKHPSIVAPPLYDDTILLPAYHDNATGRFGFPRAAGDPAPYVTADGNHNVVYRGTDGNIHVLWWNG
jgi:hypothetical protein